MSDVFQEVDEELKRQHLDKAVRAYGPLVGTVAVIAVLGVAGFTFWQNMQERRLGEAGDVLIAGMEQAIQGDPALAANLFALLAADAPEGYSMLARIHEAAARRMAGDADMAVLLYGQIAADGDVSANFRNLAGLYAGLTAISSETFGFDEVQRHLEPVANGASPWRFHAREALGYAAYRAGQYGVAASLYRQLTDDIDTPGGVATRANEMLSLTEAAASSE